MIVRALSLGTALAVLVLTSAAPAEKPMRGPDDPSKKICRTSTPTGSRLGGVTRCKTRAEWEELRAEAKLRTQQFQAANQGCLKAPNGAVNPMPICSN